MSKQRRGNKQKLVEADRVVVEKRGPQSLSERVSTDVRSRLQTLEEQRNLESLERTQIVGIRNYTCTNGFIHNIKVIRFDDTSIWVACPMFGWYDPPSVGKARLGCRERKKRCTWFVG